MRDFKWEEFKKGNIAVHCNTEEKAKHFLNKCIEKGFKWATGDEIEYPYGWSFFRNLVSYSYLDTGIVYTDVESHKRDNFKIIEWEVYTMRELSFKEVISNIKPGEVWENKHNRIARIYINENGNIQFEGDNSFSVNYSTAVNPNSKYKLKRKEYSFQEAFKAYEEGKEIESKESKFKYRKSLGKDQYYSKTEEEWMENGIFSIDEIKGLWFINE